MLYFRFRAPIIGHCYEELWFSYYQHLLDHLPAPPLEVFLTLPTPAFQHAQAIFNTPVNDTTMAAPSALLSPTIPIRETRTVSTAKRPHSLSSPLLLSTSDNNENYNPEDTLAQIQSTMVTGFVSLQQDINSLQSQVTALFTTN